MARLEERIRQARRQSGLTQEALAERIGVPPDRLRGYEEGAHVTARQLELIAVATGRPVSYFVDGAEPGSLAATGVGGRLRAALAWLSEPTGADTDAETRLAEVVQRERRFEQALAAERAKTTALEAKIADLTALLRGSEPYARMREDSAAALAERQRALVDQAQAIARDRRELEQLRSRLSVWENSLREQQLAEKAVAQERVARERERGEEAELAEENAAALALAQREAALDAKEELLARQIRAAEAREAELERLRDELEERERELAAAREAVASAPSTSPARAPVGEPASAERVGYNLATLEGLVDEREGDFPARADEWRAYIVFLREFAHADGKLPPTFNTLVREVFRELLG